MPKGVPETVPNDGLTTRQRRNQPVLAVHTGAGKGKSTAAFGMALRAWNAGLNVAVFQFVKSAKWKVGDEDPESWQMVEKLPVQYNIGHLTAAEGDTVSPDGKYVVVLNKWSVDRFAPVGPLLPQNIQLVDISDGNFKVIYDMAMGIGEPHNAQIIKTDKINAWTAYPEVGWDPIKQEKSEYATLPGEERIERNGNTVEIFMTSVRSHFTPERVRVKKGDHVIWHITNIETAHDATHGFQLGGHNISLSLEPGETVTFELEVTNDGTYAYYCTEFCSALHLEMMGYLLVEP